MGVEQTKTIQWFPGHMAKTRRQIREQLKLVDAVAEIVDARIPAASRNPELAALVEGKPRIVVMTKADMADEAATRRWLAAFERQGTPAIAVDCKTGKGVGGFVPLLRGVLQDKIAAWQAKGMKNHPIRVMVVGIPNVGKSSFINRMARGGRAKVEDRPGVTRSNQWFVTDGGVQLLDTPGCFGRNLRISRLRCCSRIPARSGTRSWIRRSWRAGLRDCCGGSMPTG